VRRLIDSVQEPGSREVVWDGRDVRGSLVAAGVYVYRLEAEGVTLSRKMNLLR
jgi:hypothetical protein